jgi:hypothetical protein
MSLLNPHLNGNVTAMFAAGFVVGIIFGHFTDSPYLMTPPLHGALPHQISKYKDGISLRFAMVDDVLHQRFPMHGADYYAHRNAEVQADLAKRNPGDLQSISTSGAYWGLLDDLAVGYVHLGEYSQAIQVMKDKLKQQQARDISGMPLYSTYANLGTAMMIEALTKMLGGGDLSAGDELRDSLDWVRKSIVVNPQAHFGREVWQVKLGEHLLNAIAHPQTLLETDMVGDDLVSEIQPESVAGTRAALGLPRWTLRVSDALKTGKLSDAEREQLRNMIMPLYLVDGTAVPFDEPTLGIIGMWRYGAGANAHFALALGKIMLDVGQPYIAWDAFERAARLADGFWPDPAIRQKFIDHCRARQHDIEAALNDVTPQQLRVAFDAELKRGTDYQQAYQEYESDKLAHGARTDDPHFYDDFNSTHGSIASDVGHADEVFFVPDGPAGLTAELPAAILGGGIFAFITACCVRYQRPRDRQFFHL